ncbi:MAG: tRNA (adenosine(37)-N6)-dimethylallyltransferase MiaA [bacterium]|nr:tRNA (adenosine(37)-N6)-dimethylallyltransferase MiaA [bacterium]
MKIIVIVIVGQTATGKSTLAVQLARKINSEIISADSRQIYKMLDIGTGKITKREMIGIVHHGLDIANPKKKYTVVDYKKYADKKIKEIIMRGKVPIIVGGTGFYIDAVVNNIILPQVEPNNKLRYELAQNTPEQNFKILKKLDKTRAKNIDSKNNVRLIRAIEIAKALGFVPHLATRSPSEYQFIKIGVKLPKEELEKKIEKRVKSMFKSGLLKEIQKLKKVGISDRRLKEFGFEYNSPTLDSVILATKQYAKRQDTWFKRDKNIKWFKPSKVEGFTPKDYKKILDYINIYLSHSKSRP